MSRSNALQLAPRFENPTHLAAFTIEPRGPFSLREAAMFGFGQRHHDHFDGTMRLAFCVDGNRAQAAVALTQASDGRVHGIINESAGEAEPAAIIAQVKRVLSLDRDATGFERVCQRDSVLRPLRAAAPGLRPPLFYSPYEAALWSVLSTRRSFAAAQRFRARLAEHAGRRFEVAGQTLWAAPLPEQLLALGAGGIARAAGIEAQRAERVFGVAQAMRSEGFSAEALRRADPDSARAALRHLPGIGPFYADLILVRATGVTDVLPLKEPRLLGLLATLYGLPEVGAAELDRLGKGWSPWRTWVAVLVRSAGEKLLRA